MHPKIKHMIDVMAAKENRETRKETPEGASSEKEEDAWFLYILECKDGSFYTGVTKDIERRLKMHNDGKASRYTRPRRPVKLLYQEPCGTKTQALVREIEVKTFSREAKEELIAANQT